MPRAVMVTTRPNNLSCYHITITALHHFFKCTTTTVSLNPCPYFNHTAHRIQQQKITRGSIDTSQSCHPSIIGKSCTREGSRDSRWAYYPGKTLSWPRTYSLPRASDHLCRVLGALWNKCYCDKMLKICNKDMEVREETSSDSHQWGSGLKDNK